MGYPYPYCCLLCAFLGPILGSYPEGPCTQIVYTMAPKYYKANVYTIWVHGPSGIAGGFQSFVAGCIDIVWLFFFFGGGG